MHLFESFKNAFNGVATRLKNSLDKGIAGLFTRAASRKELPESPEMPRDDRRTDLSRLAYYVDADRRIQFHKRPEHDFKPS